MSGEPDGCTDRWATVNAVVANAEEVVVGVVAYGSMVNAATPQPTSALDIIMIVDSYPAFWRALAGAGIDTPRARWLSPVLPPTTVLIGTPPAQAKICVVRLDHFVREMGPIARDHFFRGRLSQNVEIQWARTEANRRFLEEVITSARHLTAGWVPAYLGDNEAFSRNEYLKALIEVSYRHEIRPETKHRATEVAAAQADALVDLYEPVLKAAVDHGYLTQTQDKQYLNTQLASRHRSFFIASWIRSLGRLPKYAATTRGWSVYLVEKLRRRRFTTRSSDAQ